MLNKFIIIIAILSIFSCNPSQDKNPIDLKGKKALLAKLLEEKKALDLRILEIKTEIGDLEPEIETAKVVVTFDSIYKTDFKRFIDFQGTVVSEEKVNASSDLGGRILRLYVTEGTNVKKGQLIATVDAESMEKQKDELLKSLDLANEIYDRQKRLWEQNIGSEVQYLQAKNNKERVEKGLATIESQLKKRNVYSPISGVVDVKLLNEGELAGPGMPIVHILNTNKVKVVSDVPENYLGKVKAGDKVNVSFPAIGKDLDRPVSLIGRTIDPANRTFKLEIKVENTSDELKPNLLSIVKINDYTLKDAIVIPIDVVQQEVSGNKYVYVAQNAEGKIIAKKAYVETGESAEGKIVIRSGLVAGDRLLIKGARNVTDGQEIIFE